LTIVCEFTKQKNLEDEVYAKYQKMNFYNMKDETRKEIIRCTAQRKWSKQKEDMETKKNIKIKTEAETVQNKVNKMFIRTVGQDAPLMSLRIISDLGLPQLVLDLTLALLGYPSVRNEEKNEKPPWLPKPLKSTLPNRLYSTMHVTAVIVVACKLTYGWESWNMIFHIPNEANKDNKHRFIPFNEDQFKLIASESMIEDYLDFIEETHGESMPYFKHYKDINEKFEKVLMDNSKIPNLPTKLVSCSNNMIPPNPILAGSSSQLYENSSLYTHSNFQKTTANKIIDNSFGNYIIYKDFHTHTGTKNFYGTIKKSYLTPQPFHSHYGLLIEYVCYKMGFEPSELHYLVACIDEEIEQYKQKEIM